MFQLALLLTYDDGTPDECVVNQLVALNSLCEEIKEVHQGELLLVSFAAHPGDRNSYERAQRIRDLGAPCPPEDAERADDILRLLAMENGRDVPPIED